MKYLLKTLSIGLVVLFVASSCDVTDQDPAQSLPSETVLTSEQGANAALQGAYDAFQDVIPDDYVFSELAGEMANHTGSFPSWAAVNQHNMLTTNAEGRDLWIFYYDLINIANGLIQNVPDIEEDGFTEAEKNQIVGEASVLRALSYHSLVRFFGGVPLITTPTESLGDGDFVERSSVSVVYDQIVSDLEDAETALGANGGANASQVTGFTAKALLARVHLYRGNYEQAESYASEVIDEFSLASDYAGLFGPSPSGGEIIFRVAYTTEDANSLSFFARPNGSGGRYEYGPSGTYTGSFTSEDMRSERNLMNVNGDGTLELGKYYTINGDDDVNIVRVAEMYLIRAEARGLQPSPDYAGAAEDLNRIQRRAYGDDPETAQTYDYNTTDINSEEDLLDAVLFQRSIELAQEGHRWHDLNRTARATTTLNIDADMTLWPIPQRDMDSNPNLEQNPGY